MKIIDCCIFYNELNLLNYRLNLLDEVVDYFIIVESKHTFIGKEKKLYYDENKDIFEKFKDKIIHVIVDDFPFKYPFVNIQKNEQWVNENFQRKAISRGFKELNLTPQDIIIIADLDEIPDPNTLRKIKNEEIRVTINRLQMDFYYYNLNFKSKFKWEKCVIFNYGIYIKYKLDFNTPRNRIKMISIPHGGWHLSYFGDTKHIINKIEQFSHQEFNNNDVKNLSNIKKSMLEGSDIFNRKNHELIKIPIKDNNYLPLKYDIYLSKFFSF